MSQRGKNSQSYPIESGVEIPPPRFGARRYPFHKMAVGDSFRVPLADDIKVRAAVGDFNRRYFPKRFESRRVDEPIDTGKYSSRITRETHARFIRVWRVT